MASVQRSRGTADSAFPKAVRGVFAHPGDYARRLQRAGFRVDSIALTPRPAPVRGDIVDLCQTFALALLQALPDAGRTEFLRKLREALEPQLRDGTGTSVADYVRLPFAVARPGSSVTSGEQASVNGTPPVGPRLVLRSAAWRAA